MQGMGDNDTMEFWSVLSKLIAGEEQEVIAPYSSANSKPKNERPATRPVQLTKEQDDSTRPTYRIRDKKWLKIQKAMDQAG
jgi:hypothetical protein